MKRFKRIYIEITNICNLSCDFCPKTGRPAQFMSSESFDAILRKITGRAEFLYFHVMGEPLLHNEIGMFLDLCGKYGFKANITTNGTLIDKAADSILPMPALRQVNFSMHSFEANIDKYPLSGYLDKIFEFIGRAQKERKLLIGLRLWNISESSKNKNNDYILMRIEKEFYSGIVIENKLTPINGIKLAENVFLYQAAAFDWPDIAREDIGGRGFCYGLRDQAAILVDGTVVPCCLDAEGIINLGNIFEQDFDGIINGSRAIGLYSGFSKRQAVEKLCKKCGYRIRFSLGN